MISCTNLTFSELQTTFQLISNHLSQDEKHFKSILFISKSRNSDDNILYENSFADITFDKLTLSSVYQYITLIHYQAFGKSASTLREFHCLTCRIQNQPPNYQVWNLLGQLTLLKIISVGFNVSEIPEFAIKPVNGQESQLELIAILGQIHSIKSKAFYHLKKLNSIIISMSYLNKIEDQAFEFDHKLRGLTLLNVSSSLESFPNLNQMFDHFEQVKLVISSPSIENIPESITVQIIFK